MLIGVQDGDSSGKIGIGETPQERLHGIGQRYNISYISL